MLVRLQPCSMGGQVNDEDRLFIQNPAGERSGLERVRFLTTDRYNHPSRRMRYSSPTQRNSRPEVNRMGMTDDKGVQRGALSCLPPTAGGRSIPADGPILLVLLPNSPRRTGAMRA
jgi:hypothetical protein